MGEAACKAKIILDGGNASRLIESLCETTQNLSDEQVARLTDEVAYPILQKINRMEELAIEAQKLLIHNVLEYDGPLPSFLR